MNPVSGGPPHQVWGMGENESFNLAAQQRATMGFV
jgi:hypothetical protein